MERFRLITLVIGLIAIGPVSAQYYYQLYYDPEHYASVTTNQLARMASELVLTDQTGKIKDNIETINQNILKLVATKELIYRSLVEVNEILKDGKEVRYIVSLIDEISSGTSGLIELAKDSPQYIILAEEGARNVKYQALELWSELSRFVTKEGRESMMNHSTRDELLRNITHRLQLLRAEIYLMHQTMYWAKLNGLWNSFNPFADWVNQDRAIIDGILRNVKIMQQ